MRWLIAAGVLIASVPLASLLGSIVSRLLTARRQPERLRRLAPVAGRLVFTAALAAGLIAALGIASPDDLRPLPRQVIAFVPKLMMAALIGLVGATAADFASGAVGNALTRSTGQPQPQLVRIVRLAIIAAVVVLAVGQLGVNTRIIDTAVAAVIFGFAAMLTLLTVLGGRDIASNVAAGRYLRRIVNVGESIRSDAGSGVVRRLHGATTELEGEGGRRVHIPNRRLLEQVFEVEPRADASGSGAGSGAAAPFRTEDPR